MMRQGRPHADAFFLAALAAAPALADGIEITVEGEANGTIIIDLFEDVAPGHAERIMALAEAGADMNALEHRAYDVVTIAAVADDPDLMSLAIELGNDPGLVTSPYLGTALIAAALIEGVTFLALVICFLLSLK